VSDRTGGQSCESGTLPISTNTVEKRGPVRDKTHANIMLGIRLGSFQINLQFCWPSPEGVLSTWYSFAMIVGKSGTCYISVLAPGPTIFKLPPKASSTVFLHSCRFRSCPGGDSDERGRPASTVQSTAIVAPDHLLLHEKHVLLSGRTIAIEGGQHWRKTVQGKKACTRPYSTPLHTAKFPMQYRNDICILEPGVPPHSGSIDMNCVHVVQCRPQ